jgi:RNA polymerase sigma-70 factor (ECF subfamily)
MGMNTGINQATTLHGRGSRESLATPGLVSQAVRRAQAGDREALGFLYARYADNVCGYVRSIVHDQHEAEDITQHVFAKLIRVIGSYEERDVPFFAWILRVARNVAVDHIRHQRSIPVEEVRLVEQGGGGPGDGERMNDLTEALAMLPPDQREVLVLRHFADLSPSEIAQRTGRSEGSVHGLHHRGRRALTAELSSRGVAPVTARPRSRQGDASAGGSSAAGASPRAASPGEASPDEASAGAASG